MQNNILIHWKETTSRMRGETIKLAAKSFFCRPFCLLCLAAAHKIAHVAHSLSWFGELHVKAGYCVNPSSRVAPSLHVNRP